MPKKSYDPLAVVPSPDAIRERLADTLTLAERLFVLLELAEKLRLPLARGDSALRVPKGAGNG